MSNLKKSFKHGERVYVNFKGLLKEAVYKGVERERQTKFHAVSIPSMRKDHELFEDYQISKDPRSIRSISSRNRRNEG